MALHTYTPTEWKNAPDHKTTPINATNLNNIETGIENAYTDISTIDSAVAGKAEKDDLTSISETGSTASQAISAGTYFYLDGTLVRAKTAIANGATFTENTNYEVTTVADALEWKEGGTITTGGVALPSNFNELLIYVNVNNINVVLTATVLKDVLSATELNVRSGYYTGANTFGYFSVLITDSTITLNAVGLNGNIVTTSSTAKYYYK